MVAMMMTPIAAAAVQKHILQGTVGRAVLGGLAALASVRYGVGIYFYRETEKLERPSYEVLQKLSDGVEIRRYQPYLIAEAAVSGSGVGLQKHTAEGFRACAEYIFRKNQSKATKQAGTPAMEKMAMTAPVRIQQGTHHDYIHNNNVNDDITKVSFVMSKAYTLRTLPKPLDKKVQLRKVHSHTLAVRRFAGPPPNDERVQSERQRVENALRKAHIHIPNTAAAASTWVYGYHDPFLTPAFLRRNEVAIVLEGRP